MIFIYHIKYLQIEFTQISYKNVDSTWFLKTNSHPYSSSLSLSGPTPLSFSLSYSLLVPLYIPLLHSPQPSGSKGGEEIKEKEKGKIKPL